MAGANFDPTPEQPRPPARPAPPPTPAPNPYVANPGDNDMQPAWWMRERQAQSLTDGCSADEYFRGDYGLGLGGSIRG